MGKRKVTQQGGFTLIELLVVIVIIGILSAAIAGQIAERADVQQQSAAAAHMKAYSDAANTYIQANPAALMAAAGPTTPAVVTTAQLRSAGVLDPTFSDVTPYGQTLVLRVLEPTPGQLKPIVLSLGGIQLTDVQVHGIAARLTEAGGDGGYIDKRNSTLVVGTGGWWRVNPADYAVVPGVGHVADGLFVRMAATTDDYLHRTANANPALNSMSTNLNMQGHTLDNVGLLNIPGGGNGINLGGSYLYGDNANLATRSVSGNVYIQKLGGGSGSIVQVENINGTGSFVAPYISASTGLWAASYVNTDGSMWAAGNINSAQGITAGGDVTAAGAVYASNWLRTYGNTGWYNQSYGGGFYMTDSSWVRSYNDRGIYTGGQVQAGSLQSNSTITAAGRITAGEYVQVNGQANEGWGCSPDGLIGRTASGTLLNCENGVWGKPGGITTSVVQGPNICGPATGQQNTATVVCPAGTHVVSGGYGIYAYRAGASNAPEASLPTGNNSWSIKLGGANGGVCFATYAVCAK